MTIDTATPNTTPATVAIPVQRSAKADTLPLPVIEPELPRATRWQTWTAVAAGLLGGVLMVAGIALPW
ncbi:hypothetical protein SAMN05443637_120116 [Pseudonocardia thermophila]|jgi:hypothetical protein|uniref:Uncharacterized protein n=1 Tax=Pseudonocardia thermophila TaxID=1848 RepID=A0A1M6YMK3_PSETH|nr:hypothetical protein [Pseudonocardia thermophila]SHL19322.1 hypothetical protein SAMN05443637_120116 [Pseudonocardia thermophila]